MKHNPGFDALVDTFRPQVNELSIDTLLNWQAIGQPHQLIDVREQDEWQRDRLPGARYLGRGVMERDIESLYPDKDQVLVLYCGGGYRSVLAAVNLNLMGYTRVYSLIGGRRDWMNRQLPVES
ncbi:Rhodanese-related sulfurtransferase [Ferrimonas sediminum]|uniref:Rhodanese-related sulfurtransferase n=1 Tax=Ferrimonas sediminum TaxID=718193 RepID=A0A1G8QDA6_9GAMM|nr:rhodanese-like domain-containing protein [Ferrimonas sediminum]SDJ02681.1 Rhodanese-related sulfurtransferase [Ferrimonas sediminum]